MMVTFVSQCEKKALNKTRRVLDAFANRIGDRTWQTVITNEGLIAVKKLLRKTASKNTAVSCHWARSRSRTELVWIVGNQRKFNEQGYVPVNSTKQAIVNTQWEDDWHYLPLLKALTGLAALFHDWGKASDFFQWKLKQKGNIGDPLRHEWLSLLFFNAYVGKQTDKEWLAQLAAGKFDLDAMQTTALNNKQSAKPFKSLPNAAIAVAWLIVTHHRLPIKETDISKTPPNLQKMTGLISEAWGYCHDYDEEQLERCFRSPNNQYPLHSTAWLKAVKKQASKLFNQLDLLEKAFEDGTYRVILQYCRLSLMLGDHYYSSLEPNDAKRLKSRELSLLANTDKHKKPKQTLDEHLLGVCKQAIHNVHFLPVFEGRAFNDDVVFQSASNIRSLKIRSKDPNFQWQDKAVDAIKVWRKSEEQSIDVKHFGFFAVNMASTGKGKTFANAKIMQALSEDVNSLRFVLALGLRTLTLQTGDEYKDRIHLNDEDLAVLIGSKAIKELHEQKKSEKLSETYEDITGSESEEVLLDEELDYESLPYIDDALKTVLHTNKEKGFLYSPVLVCTIDHIMSATETKRGGRYILPTLRMMSSDLVIDEIDDFSGDDLIAIGRLIHLAAMLGRKVMISSATIPPDLAEGYFNVYQAGWELFAKMRGKKPIIGCAWFDEFKANVETVSCQQANTALSEYQQHHVSFIKRRLSKLAEQVVKRKAAIISMPLLDENDEQTIHQYFYSTIQQAIIQQHQAHAVIDKATGKHISFGVVRVANIEPSCIGLTRFLLNADWGVDIDIRSMAYHSRQVLIMRNAQEQHLDQVLKRKQGKQASLNNPIIRAHIKQSSKQHLIFILVATPVEEVGRDHDFDWAVVEPSSYRSLIQLAGRVLRHQTLNSDIEQPNMAILQHNRKGLLKKEIAFTRPGYEQEGFKLDTKDMKVLVDEAVISKSLDAAPRISRKAELKPHQQLVDLEHESTHQSLTQYNKLDADSMQGWLSAYWWLTGMHQKSIKFRSIVKADKLYLYPLDEQLKFVEKDEFGQFDGGVVEQLFGIDHEETLTELELKRLWLYRDYLALLENSPKEGVEEAALVYGELSIPDYGEKETQSYLYSGQFGLMKKTAD